MGPVLQYELHLEAVALRAFAQGKAGVHSDFEAVSADVRQYRHRNRQRAQKQSQWLGALDRTTLPRPVYRGPNARIADSILSCPCNGNANRPAQRVLQS